MELGKYILQEEKRIERSKDVKVRFYDSQNFLIVDESGDVKYDGKLIGHDFDMDDYCTCQSFQHGNVKNYIDEHGYAFQCKHIIKARQLRFIGYPVLEVKSI